MARKVKVHKPCFSCGGSHNQKRVGGAAALQNQNIDEVGKDKLGKFTNYLATNTTNAITNQAMQDPYTEILNAERSAFMRRGGNFFEPGGQFGYNPQAAQTTQMFADRMKAQNAEWNNAVKGIGQGWAGFKQDQAISNQGRVPTGYVQKDAGLFGGNREQLSYEEGQRRMKMYADQARDQAMASHQQAYGGEQFGGNYFPMEEEYPQMYDGGSYQYRMLPNNRMVPMHQVKAQVEDTPSGGYYLNGYWYGDGEPAPIKPAVVKPSESEKMLQGTPGFSKDIAGVGSSYDFREIDKIIAELDEKAGSQNLFGTYGDAGLASVKQKLINAKEAYQRGDKSALTNIASELEGYKVPNSWGFVSGTLQDDLDNLTSHIGEDWPHDIDVRTERGEKFPLNNATAQVDNANAQTYNPFANQVQVSSELSGQSTPENTNIDAEYARMDAEEAKEKKTGKPKTAAQVATKASKDADSSIIVKDKDAVDVVDQTQTTPGVDPGNRYGIKNVKHKAWNNVFGSGEKFKIKFHKDGTPMVGGEGSNDRRNNRENRQIQRRLDRRAMDIDEVSQVNPDQQMMDNFFASEQEDADMVAENARRNSADYEPEYVAEEPMWANANTDGMVPANLNLPTAEELDANVAAQRQQEIDEKDFLFNRASNQYRRQQFKRNPELKAEYKAQKAYGGAQYRYAMGGNNYPIAQLGVGVQYNANMPFGNANANNTVGLQYDPNIDFNAMQDASVNNNVGLTQANPQANLPQKDQTIKAQYKGQTMDTIKNAGKNLIGPGMAMATAIGNLRNDPNWEKELRDSTSGERVHTTNRGLNTGDTPFDLYAAQGQTSSPFLQSYNKAQFTGMAPTQISRYGGEQYEMGGEYELTQDEIDYIMANGGSIEYLD